MQLLSDSTSLNTTMAPSRNMLLQRLDRNQKDIAQCYAKLSSYICEPRTYDQFTQLSELKEMARELRDGNVRIFYTLRNELNATVRGSQLFENHLQRFQNFSEMVLTYVENVKVHHTACI